jgi:hypothetical protein
MGRRNEENCLPGCNLAVIDVDGTINIDTAEMLLADYTYLLYTTKRHTEKANRFRMVFPLSHEVKLGAREFKEFMNNIFEWLPFEVDNQTGQRSRKWLSHDDTYKYNKGELLDALLFIPKTKKSDIRKQIVRDQRSLNNLERWFINTTEEGNRSNQMIKYGLLLVDSGLDLESIKDKLIILNTKLEEGLEENEILSTILISVSKAITKRDTKK